MMQYDFTDESTVINEMETDVNMHSYPMYQQQKYCVLNLQADLKINILFDLVLFHQIYPIVI